MRRIKKFTAVLAAACLLAGCGNAAPAEAKKNTEAVTEAATEAATEAVAEAAAETTAEAAAIDLADGSYIAEFSTDSSMFRINETKDGKGILTVEDGKATIHITLLSKKILNLYSGLAQNAPEDTENWLQPTTDQVTYSDGYVEEAYGFDVPVPCLEAEFDLAIVGEKGKWYDHKVVVSNPQQLLADGTYTADVVLEGGSGKATVNSPAEIHVTDGAVEAVIVWSSSKYDYMRVGDVKYDNEAADGENSTFTIPVEAFDTPLTVIGDTTAMSTPHEVEYTLTFTLQK